MMLLATLFLVAPPTAATCALIRDLSPQYISYSHHGKRRPDYGYESDERIWFKLHNNTTCPMRLSAAFPIKFRTLPNGQGTVDPEDGQEVYLAVSVVDREGGTTLSLPPFGVGGETTLPAGQSVTFGIAANIVKRGPFTVSWGYEWEGRYSSAYFGKIAHTITLDVREDLRHKPKVLKWLDKVKDPPRRPVLSPEFPGIPFSGFRTDPPETDPITEEAEQPCPCPPSVR